MRSPRTQSRTTNTLSAPPSSETVNSSVIEKLWTAEGQCLQWTPSALLLANGTPHCKNTLAHRYFVEQDDFLDISMNITFALTSRS